MSIFSLQDEHRKSPGVRGGRKCFYQGECDKENHSCCPIPTSMELSNITSSSLLQIVCVIMKTDIIMNHDPFCTYF